MPSKRVEEYLHQVALRTVMEYSPLVREAGIDVRHEDTTREQLERDFRLWRSAMFPQVYGQSECAPHHDDLWDWAWTMPSAEEDEADAAEDYAGYPDYGAWFSRKHAKSTNAEIIVIAEGAREKRWYCLYVSEDQEQADKHVQTIQSHLSSSQIERYYPDLAERDVTKYGASRGWRRNRLVTRAGLVVDACGLDSAERGLRFDIRRPDFFVFDDVDNRHDTPKKVRKKIQIITDTILQSGAKGYVSLFAQNVIHAGSIAYKLSHGEADFMVNMRTMGVIPALRGLTYERHPDYPRGYKITGGRPTWSFFDLGACQREVNKEGMSSFLRECQHDVTAGGQGLIYDEFDEAYHVVTYSEIERVYGKHECRDKDGNFRLPVSWRCSQGQDWGTSFEHKCVTVNETRPTGDYVWNDTHFGYRETVFPLDDDDTTTPTGKVTPGRVGIEILDREKKYKEGERMDYRVMSHEQATARNAYVVDLPKIAEGKTLLFIAHETKGSRSTGIDAMKELQMLLPEPHPFRYYPEHHPKAGQRLPYRPRWVLAVPDAEGALYYDESQPDGLGVLQATTAAGFPLTRKEWRTYSWKEDSTGLEKQEPQDTDNDASDAWRMWAARWGAHMAAESPASKAKKKLAKDFPHLASLTLLSRDDAAGYAAAVQTAEMQLAKIERELKEEARPKAHRTAERHRLARRRGGRG